MQGRWTRLALSVTNEPFLAEAPAPCHCCPGAYSLPAIGRASFPWIENAHTAGHPKPQGVRSCVNDRQLRARAPLGTALRCFLRAPAAGTASLGFDSWLCYRPTGLVTSNKLQPLSFTTCKGGTITASQGWDDARRDHAHGAFSTVLSTQSGLTDSHGHD